MRMPTAQCVMRASPSENHLQMSIMRAFKFNYTILKMVWSQMVLGIVADDRHDHRLGVQQVDPFPSAVKLSTA